MLYEIYVGGWHNVLYMEKKPFSQINYKHTVPCSVRPARNFVPCLRATVKYTATSVQLPYKLIIVYVGRLSGH